MKILNIEKRNGQKIHSTNEAIDYIEQRYGRGPFTAIVEVKTSKADFQKDLDFKFSGRVYPAHFCYLAYPASLGIEIPNGWIGMLLNDDCDRIIKLKYSCFRDIHPQHLGDTIDLIAAVGIRRHHRTEYAERKAWIRSYRAEERDRSQGNRLHSAMRAIEDAIIKNIHVDEIPDLRYIKDSFLRKDVLRIIGKLKEKLRYEAQVKK